MCPDWSFGRLVAEVLSRAGAGSLLRTGGLGTGIGRWSGQSPGLLWVPHY